MTIDESVAPLRAARGDRIAQRGQAIKRSERSRANGSVTRQVR
jgi:hypothetical protein